MKKYCFILMCLSFLLAPSVTCQKIEKNQYGEMISSEDGNRINYTKSDIDGFSVESEKAKPDNLKAISSAMEIAKDTISLASQNIFTIMGTRIGRNSMHSVDLDGDEVLDLLCSASSGGFYGNTFWYILNYDEDTQNYSHKWVSASYDNIINVIEVVDFNDNGEYAIVLGFENGDIKIYDGKNKELINSGNISNTEINDIIYADANNDGTKELVIATDNKCYLVNALTLVSEYEISNGANHVRVGNVKDNGYNQIVLSSGSVYTLVNNIISVDWTFTTGYEGMIELCDVDRDDIEEIILAEGWYNIKVLDVDTETTKFTYEADYDIESLYMYDANNDGVKDIIYGDGQWGDVVCVDPLTQQRLWSVRNPEHGVAAINVADLDGDGDDELIWTAGWTSTGSDYLYVYDLQNETTKWQSADIVGPFYAVAIGDVDGDDKDDIVAMSYESESGYDGAIIFIFDAETKQLKWQSSSNFLGSIWTGVFDVSIYDVTGDDKKEIIIAAGETYTGRVWIIDGNEHTIISEQKYWSDDLDEFYSVHVDDLGDDDIQIVAINDDGVFFIDPSNLVVNYQVSLGSNYYYGKKPIVKCADVTGNDRKEAIACQGNITVINTNDFSSWSTTDNNYINIDTIDYNKDGITDILACTSAGEIVVIDGVTKLKILEKRVEESSIGSVKAIYHNESLIFIYSHNGRVNFYIDDENRYVTQFLETALGQYSAMQLYSDNDTKMILGSQNSILELDGSFLTCLSMDLDIATEDVSCSEDNGEIAISSNNENDSYTYKWSNNSTLSQLTNLEAGTYTVEITNAGGCTLKKSINVEQAFIEAEVNKTDVGCIANGSIDIDIKNINEPYDFAWSNSSTNLNLTNVEKGSYTITITDSKDCSFSKAIEIEKDTLIVENVIYDNVCNGGSNGAIVLSIASGRAPFTYNWSNGKTGKYIFDVLSGIYSVSVIDSMGCEKNLELEVLEPDAISYQVSTSPDVSKTVNWEGAIMIDSIQGGTAPYSVYWPSFGLNAVYVNTLPQGDYSFVITDSNDCSIEGNTAVSIYTSVDNIKVDDLVKVFPNPVTNKLYVQEKVGMHKVSDLSIIDTAGRILLHKNITEDISTIDLSNLSSGTYILKVSLDNDKFYSKKIVKK